jgi:serine phosphatase RsbU (regulator of sigma subunit)
MNSPHPTVPTLELVRRGSTERVFEIKGPDAHIGRTPGSELQFDDQTVSKNHARVERRPDGTFYIIDLESLNGTYVDGMRLTPFQAVRLFDRSRIKIVDLELVFRDPTVRLRKKEGEDSTVLGSIDDLSSDHLAKRVSYPTEALKAILDVNRALGRGADLNEMLDRVLEGLMAVFPRAERGFIVTAAEDGTFPLRAIRYRNGGDLLPALSETILRQVVSDGRALLISDAANETTFKDRSSVTVSLRTALVVPLPGSDGRPLGMVQLDSRVDYKGFSTADLDLLATLAIPVGVAVENHGLLSMRASWVAAGAIQRALLPRCQPDIPGYSFWECYRPALEVGGDLYDYIPIESCPNDERGGTRWAVTIGDVVGKGMSAALMMAGICPEVRHLVRMGVAPEDVLTRINRLVFDRGVEDLFVTLALVAIDPGSHRLTIANAGHPLPLIRRSNGSIEPIDGDVSGTPLGVARDAVYRSTTAELGSGDVVFLYTDGGYDARDRHGQAFGEERIRRALAEAPPGIEAVGEAVLASVRDHAAGRSQFDDIAFVCFGRHRQAGA